MKFHQKISYKKAPHSNTNSKSEVTYLLKKENVLYGIIYFSISSSFHSPMIVKLVNHLMSDDIDR